MANIMVTGVGAIIGYGILRELKKPGNDHFLVGADIYSDAVGQAWCDSFEQAPYTSAPEYLDWLKKIIKKYQIELMFLGIEQDLYFLINHVQEIEQLGCKLAINNSALVNLTKDKWLVYEALNIKNDSALIPTLLNGEYEEIIKSYGLPFLLKPRSGYASKGIVKVKERADFERNKEALGHHLMIQPIVGTDDEEYTVSVFGDGKGEFKALIAMRRTLANDGSTAKALIVQPDNTLVDTLKRLCSYFKPIGPTNFQFRKAGEHWFLLEINPRISSTTSMRAAFGYSEPQMCIDFYLNNKAPKQPQIKGGFAARYIEDHIIYDGTYF